MVVHLIIIINQVNLIEKLFLLIVSDVSQHLCSFRSARSVVWSTKAPFNKMSQNQFLLGIS